MKKTFLTALIAIFIMASFANNNTPLKPNVKELKIEKKLDKRQQSENISETNSINKTELADPCIKATLSCGLTGWFCGANHQSMYAGIAMAEKIHCKFDNFIDE